MPANTSPDNIEYPVSTDPVAPLETVFANMANSVQDAFDGFRIDWNDFEDNRAIQTFRWADASERSSQTGMVAGDEGYQVDTGVQYRYDGSAWKPWESDWITYTTTLTNLAVGSGGSASQLTRYRYEQGRVRVSYRFVLGSSGASVGTIPKFTLPVTAVAPAHSNAVYGGLIGSIFDDSLGIARVAVVLADGTSTSTVRIFYLDNVAGLFGSITAAAPWTWAASDALQGELVYDPA